MRAGWLARQVVKVERQKEEMPRWLVNRAALGGATSGIIRPTWNEYFEAIADAVAARASCPRASVGAVLVKDNRILATGYNGAPSGEPHCLDVGCLLEDGHCQRVQHAEVNAVAFAARYGVSIAGSRLYLGGDGRRSAVCRECAKVLRAAAVEWP